MATPGTITTHNLPQVVLIGRANVGKSTLFNKLIEEKKALVSNIAGTTRTNNEGDVIWRGANIHLIDTGGQDTKINEQFAEEILDQAEKALGIANVVILVADAVIGILPEERKLAKKLKEKLAKKKIPIIFVANKCDNAKIEASGISPAWQTLGLGHPVCVSGVNGRGTGDLLDLIYVKLKKSAIKPKSKKINVAKSIRVSLVGRPNVGKSSLFNKMIGQDKVIVSPVAHATREPFDTTLIYEEDGQKYDITFVDTAGIRRKSRVEGLLESSGVGKSIASIENSDIILLVLDGSADIASQDLQLGGLIEKRSKGVIIIVNKWDLSEDNSDAKRNEVKKMIHSVFPHLDFAEIMFASGLTGYRVHQVFPLIIQMDQARKTVVPQMELSHMLEEIVREHRPARGKGTRFPEIRGIRQVKSDPPIFEIFIKFGTSLHLSYVNFIENKLRERFNFVGTPIVIKLTKMKK
ncbi:MAG: ribosome biogenesis GTPase Der [Patescibacteria group bacterium]